MKITKSQLKQIIKEELNEITDDEVDMMPAPSGTAQGISVVKQHLGEMVAELQPAGLGPDLSQTMGRTGHTGIAPALDRLALDIYKMIMRELGG